MSGEREVQVEVEVEGEGTAFRWQQISQDAKRTQCTSSHLPFQMQKANDSMRSSSSCTPWSRLLRPFVEGQALKDVFSLAAARAEARSDRRQARPPKSYDAHDYWSLVISSSFHPKTDRA